MAAQTNRTSGHLTGHCWTAPLPCQLMGSNQMPKRLWDQGWAVLVFSQPTISNQITSERLVGQFLAVQKFDPDWLLGRLVRRWELVQNSAQAAHLVRHSRIARRVGWRWRHPMPTPYWSHSAGLMGIYIYHFRNKHSGGHPQSNDEIQRHLSAKRRLHTLGPDCTTRCSKN